MKENFNHLTPRRFYMKAVKDKLATAAEGRPVFKDVEMFEARISGDASRTIVFRAHEKSVVAPKTRIMAGWDDDEEAGDEANRTMLSYAEIFEDEYAAWKRSGVMAESGTPIEMLAFLSPRRIAELKVKNVTTVEALATLPDRVLKDCGMSTRDERDMAKNWLGNAEKVAEGNKVNATLALYEAKMKALEEKLDFAMRNKAEPKAEPADEFDMTDEEMRAVLTSAGIKVRANASRDKLAAALREVQTADVTVDGPAHDAFTVEDD
jgi:hypothetical protein